MARRQDKCQQRQGLLAQDGTDALTVGVNVTLTGPGTTESRPGGGMEVKVKVLQGRTPESDAITHGITATATSSHHTRPVTAPAAISDEKRLETEQLSNDTEGVEFTFTRGSSHFQDADHRPNDSDDVMEIEVLPISRNNADGLPIYHRTVATVSSGKHRDVVYIDGKIEARSSHEQTIIKEDVSSCTGIRELSLKQESKHEKTSFIIENMDDPTEIKATSSECRCEDSDKDYTVTETENIEILTDSIELKICGTMTTSTRDSSKDIPENCSTDEFEKPPSIKKTGSCLSSDESEKCPAEDCLPICPNRSKDIAKSEAPEDERRDITMTAELSFKLSCPITPDDSQKEPVKSTESGTLTGEFKVIQDNTGDMKSADLELLIQETRYVSPTDSFTDVVHETHAIVSQSAPMIEKRGKDLQKDDEKSENMNNKNYEDIFRAMSLDSFSEEVYELSVVTEDIADGERQTCTCSGDQDNRDEKGIQSDSVQKETSETMTSDINLLEFDDTARRFRELLSESKLVDQSIETEIVDSLSMATSISEDHLQKENLVAKISSKDNADRIRSDQNVDSNNNVTGSPGSESSSCVCDLKDVKEATDDSSSKEDIDTEAIECECKIEGEMTHNKGMQSDAIEESQVGTMTSDIEFDSSEERGIEDDETSKLTTSDGEIEQDCVCSLEAQKSTLSRGSRKSALDVTETLIQTDEIITKNYSTMTDDVTSELTARSSVERGRKPEITEDDILDDDGVTFDTRRYSRPTADQSRDARSPLRDQLITPANGPRNGGTNESLINFMRDLWSELESTNPPPLGTEPRDNIVFRTFRHQVEPEETTIKPVTNRVTKSSTEIAEGKGVTQEDGTDVSELGDVDDSLFAVSSNDTELTAEISVTMTVVDEAGDNLQEQLNADDDMTDMLFMQMLDNDNILEGEAVDIVQRIVNLPGFDELLMDSSTMTEQNMEDKTQMVDMCVQSDTILSVHSGGSIGKVSARSVPLVVDKKDVAYRRNPTSNQQQDAGDEMEKDSEQEKQENGQEKPVDGSEDTKIPNKCLLNECSERCSGYANKGSEVPTLEYESKPYSDILSDTEEDSAYKALSGDEDSTMPELQDVVEGDKSAEDGNPAPTETKDLNTTRSTTSGQIGTISVIDTVAIDTDGITVRSSATVVNPGKQSVTDCVIVKTDNLTIASSLTVTTEYSSDTIPTKKSETRENKETPEVDSVAVKSEDELKEARSATDAMPDEAGDVYNDGVCNDDTCTKKSVPQTNEETDTAQVQIDEICTKCSVTSTESPSLTESSPDDIGDIRRISSPTLMGTTENMEVQTDDISTKSAAMTTEEISEEIEATLDQNEDLSKKQDDVTSDEIGKEAEITQEQTDDLTARSSPSRIETPCPCVEDTLSVQRDEIITESKSAVAIEETANITDTVTVQTDDVSTKSSATMTANDFPNLSDMMPEDTDEITSKSSTSMKIKEESPDLSDLKAEGDLGDTERVKDRTSSISMQTDHISAKDSSTMTDKKSKDGQGISFTETDSILITENITDIKITTDINLTENDGTVAGFEKEEKLEISAIEQKLDIISTTIVKSNPVFPIMDENCHKCCAVKSDMAVQDCIKCCAQFGADKNILDKKSPESMVEMGRKSGVVILEQDQLDSEDVTDTSVQSDEIPTSEATTGEHSSLQEMSDLLSNVSMQCDHIHTPHIGISMSATSKSNHTMLSKLNVQSDPMLKKHPSFDEHIDKKSTTQSYHAVSKMSTSMTVRSSSHLGVSEEGQGTISKQSITDTDSDIFDNSKIPPDTGAPIMSIVQINAPDHLIHLISVSVQNEPISTRNSSTMTELKLTELTDSHVDVESKDSKLEPAELTPEIENQGNVEEVEVGADLDKQDVDITTEDKSDAKDETKRASVSDKNMQTKSSKTISTMTDTMPTHFSDRVIQYGSTVRTHVASSTHSDGGGTRERHETSRNIAEEIQILLHEKTIKTVDMDSPDFVTRDYMTESNSKLADGPEVTPSAEKIEDEVPELMETLSPSRAEIAEAEGDFRPRDDENMNNDGIDFLMPEGDFLMPADGVPVTPPTTPPPAPPVLSEPTVTAISEKQDGRFTMSDGPMELVYDVHLPDSHVDHPESPPRSREAEPAQPETPSPEQETPPSTESALQEPTVGKELLTPDNLQFMGTELNADSSPPQTECYSSMTEGDFMLHKIKKLPAPTPSQTSQTDKEDLVSSAECIACEPCHPEIKRKKKYKAPAPPPLSTEKPVEEVKEEEQVVSSAGEQEREETEKPLQRKGSFRKSLFKKLKFEKTVKQKSSAKGSDEQATQKQRGSTKPTTKPPPESTPAKIKTDPSIHRKKCVPLSDFPDKTFSKPDSRKTDQIQSKPKINSKPPLRLSNDRTFRSRGKPTRADELPALEDRTDVRPSCAAKVQDEILQQLGHKLQMIGQPRKREDASPRRTIMIGRDLPQIIGSVPIDSERDCLELRDLTSRLQNDGNDDGALFISLDNPPPGTEVVVQTAECPGKAHSLKIRSTQPVEDTRAAAIGLIKAKATHLQPRRVISPIRFQPRAHYLMRPSSPTNIPPELRLTPLQPYEHCGARDGMSSQTLSNLVLESPPVGTAYVVFPVPTDGTQSDEGTQRVLSEHIHRQADAVSVAIVDNNIVPYPHSNPCMCQDHCQNRVCLNQPQRMYSPAPDWIGTRQCTRNLCNRQGTRRWCSVHHTFHRD